MKPIERKCSIALFHNLWVEKQAQTLAQPNPASRNPGIDVAGYAGSSSDIME
jgi:hypothetical protein